MPDVTLRILASPYLSGTEKAGKLCVPFYFHKRGERGGYIGKRAFYNANLNDDILPNGRKVYLHHPLEWAILNRTPVGAKPGGYEDPELIDTDTLAVVCALGDPKRLEPGLPVRTPFTPAQDPRQEGRSYEWFNENDHYGRQALQPVPTDAAKRLPPLDASYQEANRSGLFFNSDVGVVADKPAEPDVPLDTEAESWLNATLDRLGAGSQTNERSDRLKGRELANEVVAITDAELRSRVFAAIVGRCKRHGCMLNNPADRVYRKAHLIAVYV